jgi:hypothetical protein
MPRLLNPAASVVRAIDRWFSYEIGSQNASLEYLDAPAVVRL